MVCVSSDLSLPVRSRLSRPDPCKESEATLGLASPDQQGDVTEATPPHRPCGATPLSSHSGCDRADALSPVAVPAGTPHPALPDSVGHGDGESWAPSERRLRSAFALLQERRVSTPPVQLPARPACRTGQSRLWWCTAGSRHEVWVWDRLGDGWFGVSDAAPRAGRRHRRRAGWLGR